LGPVSYSSRACGPGSQHQIPGPCARAPPCHRLLPGQHRSGHPRDSALSRAKEYSAHCAIHGVVTALVQGFPEGLSGGAAFSPSLKSDAVFSSVIALAVKHRDQPIQNRRHCPAESGRFSSGPEVPWRVVEKRIMSRFWRIAELIRSFSEP
jgi:hypothetical protein